MRFQPIDETKRREKKKRFGGDLTWKLPCFISYLHTVPYVIPSVCVEFLIFIINLTDVYMAKVVNILVYSLQNISFLGNIFSFLVPIDHI